MNNSKPYIPKCPACGSTNVSKISHFLRGAASFFKPWKVFDSIGKTWIARTVREIFKFIKSEFNYCIANTTNCFGNQVIYLCNYTILLFAT